MNSIKTVFPGRSLFFEHLVVWRKLHSRERVEVLAAFREEIVPTSNETSLVLIVDEVESVIRPSLLDLFEHASAPDSKREIESKVWTNLFQEFLESHFSLSLHNHVLDERLVSLEIEIPY